MAQLVRGHAEQPAVPGAIATEHDHRVLHPAHRPRDVDGRGVGVAIPFLRVMLDRVACILGRARPVRIRFRWVERLDQHAVVPARVPHEGGRGRPRHVANVPGGEMPRQRGPGSGGSTGRLPHLGLRDDRDGGVGPHRPREPGALVRGEHDRRVRERARRRHDEASRHGDRHVEVAVLEIDLALTQILLGVPAAHVVVHGHAWIPLRDLVQPAPRELLPTHAVRPVLGHFEPVRQLELRPPAGREGSVELHPHHGAIGRGRERRPARRLLDPAHHAHVLDRVAAFEPTTGEPRVGRIQEGAPAVRLVNVLVEL